VKSARTRSSPASAKQLSTAAWRREMTLFSLTSRSKSAARLASCTLAARWQQKCRVRRRAGVTASAPVDTLVAWLQAATTVLVKLQAHSSALRNRPARDQSSAWDQSSVASRWRVKFRAPLTKLRRQLPSSQCVPCIPWHFL
jgi:hypothetical protein